MKILIYLFALLMLVSCGGNGTGEEQAVNDSLYTDNHEWLVGAQELKEKLAAFQASFVEIGNKEVEETICGEGETVPYTGNKDEMNIWLMATYMLDNFSDSTFAKNDFKMPDVMIKSGIPLRELDWMNFNSGDSTMFDLYREYPDLANVPKKRGEISNDEIFQKSNMVLKALEDGLFVVIAITDYVRPIYLSSTDFEGGHVMGYIMFADWQSGQLSCLSPLLAQNSATINFDTNAEYVVSDTLPKELNAMYADLQMQTYNALDSIARSKTGFAGKVWVNNAANLEKYKE